jgi:hypothetical protein
LIDFFGVVPETGRSTEQELFDIHKGVNRDYKVAVRRMVYNLKVLAFMTCCC